MTVVLADFCSHLNSGSVLTVDVRRHSDVYSFSVDYADLTGSQ